MAVSSDVYFSNSIVGQPMTGTDIDIYEANTSPKYAIGFGFTRADGNKFRYCHFGLLTTTPGLLVATDISESYAPDSGGAVTVTASPNVYLGKYNGERVNCNAIGSRYMMLTVTATADEFAGGYVIVTSGTGYGWTYRIKGNTISGTGASTESLFELDSPIVVALDCTQTALTLVGSLYANVEAATATDKPVVGATMSCVSTGGYGWICTHGVVAVKQGANLTGDGYMACLDTNVAGAVRPLNTIGSSSSITPIIGYYLRAASVSNFSTIYLTLE
jgi:hypothetical protein